MKGKQKAAKGGKRNHNAKPHGGAKKPMDASGATVWVLTIVGSTEYTPDGRFRLDGDITTALFTSFEKVLGEVETIFREEGLSGEWERAKGELKERFYFHDPAILNGDRFVVDCERVY